MTNTGKPVFIVGCSRGGTTLLQSILGNHASFQAFPETNVLFSVLDDLDYRRFGSLIGRRRIPAAVLGRAMNSLGYTMNFSWDRLQAFLDLQGVTWTPSISGRGVKPIATIFTDFCALMDQMSKGKRWIEKSPQNIFCLHLIMRYIPSARIVHIVRDGRDNLASLIDAARKYEAFGRFAGSNGLQKATRYYNESVMTSFRYLKTVGHGVLRYEDVVASPLQSLKMVEDIVDVEITEDMLRYEIGTITHRREKWKVQDKEIRAQPSKFNHIFSAEEKAFIDRNIVDTDQLFPRQFGVPCPEQS